MKFENKIVLITGASEGIGKAIAGELAKKKAKLFLLARNVEKLADQKKELETHTEVYFIKCDVTNIQEIKAAMDEAVLIFKRIDIAILNAGIGYRMKLIDFDFEKTKELIDTNFYGVINFFEHLIPIFNKQKAGIIVGISSLADARGFPGSAAYCSSKSAITTFLESARIELKRHNIKVITVRPGFVDTNMIKLNELNMKFVIDVQAAAQKIINGIEKEKDIIQFPFVLAALTFLVKFLPARLFDVFMKATTPK